MLWCKRELRNNYRQNYPNPVHLNRIAVPNRMIVATITLYA